MTLFCGKLENTMALGVHNDNANYRGINSMAKIVETHRSK